MQRFFLSPSEKLHHEICKMMLQLLETSNQEEIIIAIENKLEPIHLSTFEKPLRIDLMDTAIKVGCLPLVKFLAERFIADGFENDIKIPYEQHVEHAYRPVFWLAAVVTRPPQVPESNYNEIEEYLCKRFDIPKKVEINGHTVTRDEYVAYVNDWKKERNQSIRDKTGREGDRYPLPNPRTSA